MTKQKKTPTTKPQKTFEFTKTNLKKAKDILEKYPDNNKRSALLPLLDIAQRQNDNWLPRHALDYVAEFLNMPAIKVYEVATFYTMFNLQPIGKNFIQICRTTPCWLRGSEEITNTCKKKLGIDIGETTKDGKFTLVEVECLGACVNAPMVQINDNYYEDLTPQNMEDIINNINNNKKIDKGSQIGRQCSAPIGELTTLK